MESLVVVLVVEKEVLEVVEEIVVEVVLIQYSPLNSSLDGEVWEDSERDSS